MQILGYVLFFCLLLTSASARRIHGLKWPGHFPFPIPERPSQQRSYILISRNLFGYSTDQYSNWSSFTECSPTDCTRWRTKTCLDDSYRRRIQFRWFKGGCPVRFLKETEKCEDIPECQPTPPFTENVQNDTTPPTCGVQPTNKIKWKIAGGLTSPAHSWPWQVALVLSEFRGSLERYVCGATLISPSWLVTAAHCIDHLADNYMPPGQLVDARSYYNLNNLVIRLGDHHRLHKDKWETETRVSKVIMHPGYRRNPFINMYDVALIKLKKPVETGPGIDFACLPREETTLPDGTACWAVGWGHTTSHAPDTNTNNRWTLILEQFFKPSRSGAGTSPELKQVRIPLVNIRECQNIMPGHYINDRMHVCAGELGKDTCTGDSGGGLFCHLPGTDRFQLYGVTSFGSSEGCGSGPGVYANMVTVLPWIKRWIAQ